jgi:hypothetical protein
MPTRTLSLAVLALIGATRLGAQPTAQQIPDVAPYLIEDRNAEVALARSAAPKDVSDGATVLVLTRSGFVEAARGASGFTCLVARSFAADPEDPGFWNPRVRAPHCFNPPAVRTVLPEMLKRAEWVLSGVSRSEIETRTRRAYDSHELPLPAAGAMAYMLSPQQHLVDSNPHWMPHLMFYYDRSLPAAAWGAGGMRAPVIDGSAGDPQSPVLVLLIPVRQWSDGTPALGDMGHP